MKHLSILLAVLLNTALLTQSAYAQYSLPDIGTAAVTTLSIAQEKELGTLAIRQVRAQMPIVDDPLINHYINALGLRLARVADNSQMDFHFYLLNMADINAFAFFGGNIFINAGLIVKTENENELASVISHEIAHVTQRHLARSLEQRKANTPYTLFGALGALLLGVINPQAGIMALSTTIAGTQQSIISFTQSNEQEADRIGLRILVKAGFDPHAMPTFLQKITDLSLFTNKPPEMLLTHPLPNTRLTDARNRANQYKSKSVSSSLDYYLAKARIAGFYISKQNINTLIKEYSQGNNDQKIAALYAQALEQSNKKRYSQASMTIDKLLSRYPTNTWFIDLASDIDIQLNKTEKAIIRLTTALKLEPENKILQINLANVYISAHQLQQAINLLHRYTHNNPNDINGWELLIDTYAAQKKGAEELSARAELAALHANFDKAIVLLTNASKLAAKNSLNQSRYDSRILQLKQLKERAEYYKKL